MGPRKAGPDSKRDRHVIYLFNEFNKKVSEEVKGRENGESTVLKAPQAPKTAMSASSRLGAPN